MATNTFFTTNRPRRSSSSSSAPPSYTAVDLSLGPPPAYTPPGTIAVTPAAAGGAHESPPAYAPLPFPSRRWVYSRTVVSQTQSSYSARFLREIVEGAGAGAGVRSNGNVDGNSDLIVNGNGNSNGNVVVPREAGPAVEDGGRVRGSGDMEQQGELFGGGRLTGCVGGWKVGRWMWFGLVGFMVACVVLVVFVALWARQGRE
ncbi:hypothetical protein B0A55_01253 [Friedmanniomyces simplex]|uniref:Uncharacterized protein n=1 Tax=Friedmanniomyces simplex TaxID=329884 RepID=A0A4U0XXK9_9PEZI|nr:hypothetical protein B0A55_01253 [Friedmanniomyces simplex]